MAKECAYCGAVSPATREHVIPRFIIARRTEKWDTFNQREQVFFQGDPEIKDVCKPCNSGRLSALDSYVDSLWDEYFERIVMPGDKVMFRYDFARLVPWLLKVSYNAARASKNQRDIPVLRRYVPYILGEESRPPLAIYLELMTPIFLTAEEVDKTDPILLARLPRDSAGRVMLEPREIRPGTGAYFGVNTTRLLALHSYYFYLILATIDVTESRWKQARRAVRQAIPDATYIDERATEVRVAASRHNFLDSKAPHMLRHADAYKQRREEYLKNLRR